MKLLCQCGCGKIVKLGNKWIHGHNIKRENNPMKRPEVVAKISGNNSSMKRPEVAAKMIESKRGIKHSKDHKKKISVAMIGNTNSLGYKHSKEHTRKIAENNIGKKRSEKAKRNISKALKGRHLSEEHCKAISKALKGKRNAMKGKRRTEENKIKCSKAVKKLWQDPEYQRIQYKARTIKPNKPEQYIIKLLNDLFLNEYRYVGDFQFFLGGRNPDFMNINGQKKLIELYGDYWHRNDNPQDRIDHFKQYGFDTLVIWEHELKNKLRLKSKLINFHDNKKINIIERRIKK